MQQRTLFLFLCLIAFVGVKPFHCHIEAINTGEMEVGSVNDHGCVIVVFGATGDLTARKLMPALYNLVSAKKLSERTTIVGAARRSISHSEFRGLMQNAVASASHCAYDQDHWNAFSERLFYQKCPFELDDGYEQLSLRLRQLEKERGGKLNYLYLLATDPTYYRTIITQLARHQLLKKDSEGTWRRLLLEKPFGRDLKDAQLLQQHIGSLIDEEAIYRVDHYLGKAGVDALTSFRFDNGRMEPLWTGEYIDHVQITLSEEIGIGKRGAFWEAMGYLRDIAQNHLLQLITILCMEKPHDGSAKGYQEAKERLLGALRLSLEENDYIDIIRGQYTEGKICGREVCGYLREDGVSSESTRETFMAGKLCIDNGRWRDVPIYFRGGKRLAQQLTEIAVVFKPSVNILGCPNPVLRIRIQPKPAISLHALDSDEMRMYFESEKSGCLEVEAYEKLLHAAYNGEKRLFVSLAQQLAGWRLFTPVLKAWEGDNTIPLYRYPAGSWGPEAAADMLERDGRSWLNSPQ